MGKRKVEAPTEKVRFLAPLDLPERVVAEQLPVRARHAKRRAVQVRVVEVQAERLHDGAEALGHERGLSGGQPP
jgi:hypothetical protein